MWQLKANRPPFEVVDGTWAGKRFAHGQNYQEIPENEQHWFEHSGELIIDKMAENDNKAGRKGKKDQEEVNNA